MSESAFSGMLVAQGALVAEVLMGTGGDPQLALERLAQESGNGADKRAALDAAAGIRVAMERRGKR